MTTARCRDSGRGNTGGGSDKGGGASQPPNQHENLPSKTGKPSGGGSTSSSIQVIMLDSTDGSAHYGQRVTFNVSTTATTQPLVSLKCSQAGEVVYSGSTGFYDSYPWPWTQVQTLTSTAWTGGAADCVATLYRYTGKGYSNLATASFGVLA